MDWRAVGIGVAVGAGASLAYGVLSQTFDVGARVASGALSLWVLMLVGYSVGAAIDIATGAVAGALARQRGALHGLAAGTIASLLTPVMGLALMLVNSGGRLPVPLEHYLLGILPTTLGGIVLATIAGAVAAPIAARRAQRAG